MQELNEEIRLALAYYILFKHPIVFNDFFLPKAWGGKPYKTRLYQFGYCVADECVVVGGRSFGKSILLEASMAQNAINDYNEESLLTTFRRMHVKDRFEKVISYFTLIPYLRKFLRGKGTTTRESITRTPFYDIHLRNGHSLKGISVGDDPLAVAIQGTHPSRRYVDEMQTYPSEAWVKFQSTRDPRGSKDKFMGCADGRQHTPYFNLDTKVSRFKNKKFHITRLSEPGFNQEDKLNLVQTFGSEEANEYLHQILAEWGEPEWGVWPSEAIHACIDKTEAIKGSGILQNHMKITTISAKTYKGCTPGMVIQDLRIPQGVEETILAIDAGYSEPSVILPFMRISGKWHLYNIIELRDRIIPDDQTEIIDYIADQYQATSIPIDCTSADGRAVASSLQNPKRSEFEGKGYDKRVMWVEFNKYFEVRKEIDKTTDKEVSIKEKIKDKTTALLRQMFSNREFLLFYSEKLFVQFNAESQKRSDTGNVLIKTPDWVHIPEAFRCFMTAVYLKYMVHREVEEIEPVCEMAHAEYTNLGVDIFHGQKEEDDDEVDAIMRWK